jgi:DNA-binding transcriptional regulator YiaG
VGVQWKAQGLFLENTVYMYFVFFSSRNLWEKGDIQSAEMSPARVRRLIAKVEAWRKANHIKQKDLAASLGKSPQQLNNIIQDREDPTGEQTLHMQELIRTKPVEKPKEK